MEKQNLTPHEHADDALLSRILGTDCPCNGNDRQKAREYGALPDTRGYVDARCERSTCGRCGCAYDENARVCGFGVENSVLAALYTPLQAFDEVYDTDVALSRGTMFAALDKPFYGDGREVDCRGREK
jgi:hypothetical protein